MEFLIAIVSLPSTFQSDYTVLFTNQKESILCTKSSALDKLLGQLGIYATWLSSIAYLRVSINDLI